MQGEGFVDLARTSALWRDVYQGQRSLIERGDWVDRASLNIPILYAMTGGLLGQLLDSSGETNRAKEVFDTTRRIVAATRMTDIFPPAFLQPQSSGTPPLDSPPRTTVPTR